MNTEKKAFLKKITPYDTEGQPGKLLLVWGDGITTEVELEKISEPNRTRAVWHGLSQRFGDSVAGCSKDHAYDYARKQVDEIYNQLQTQDWNRGGKGGGEGEQSILDLIDAIARLKKKPVEAISPVVRNADKDQRNVWRKHPAINTILLEIAQKRQKELAKNSDEFEFPDLPE